MGDAGMSGGFLGARRRLVDVIERHHMPECFSGRNHPTGDFRGDFLPTLLVVRDVPLRHVDGLAEGDLRQSETLADLEDIVHVANISPTDFKGQQSHRSTECDLRIKKARVKAYSGLPCVSLLLGVARYGQPASERENPNQPGSCLEVCRKSEVRRLRLQPLTRRTPFRCRRVKNYQPDYLLIKTVMLIFRHQTTPAPPEMETQVNEQTQPAKAPPAGVVGENGIKTGVLYRIDDSGALVEAEA